MIEQYRVASGEQISAGDFVRIVNKLSADTQLSTNDHSGAFLSAVQITETKVLVVHSSDQYGYVYGMVFSISDREITAGVDTRLHSYTNAATNLQAIRLTENRALILCSTIVGLVVEISGMEITLLKTNSIGSYGQYANKFSAVALSPSRVFVGCGFKEALLLNIGEDGSVGLSLKDDIPNVSYYLNDDQKVVIKTSENTILYLHGRGEADYGSGYVYAIVGQVNGNRLAWGEPLRINHKSIRGGYTIHAVKMDNGDIFIADNTDGNITALTLRVVGLNVSFVIQRTPIAQQIGAVFNVVNLDNGSLFLIYRDNSFYCHGMILKVGSAIDVLDVLEISPVQNWTTRIDVARLTNNELLFIRASSIDSKQRLTATIIEVKRIIPVTDGGYANGLAKTKGAAGEMIDVYIPGTKT